MTGSGTAANIIDPRAALDRTAPGRETAALRLSLWHLGAQAGALAGFTPAEIADLPLSDRIRHAAIAAEAGQIRKAVAIMRPVLREDPEIFLSQGFAGLLDTLAACDAKIAAAHAPLLDQTARWRAGFGCFERQVRATDTRLCVVGNAPSLVGQGAGAEIDDHDLVIRFNNFRTGGALTNDTGTRTDIWVRTGHMQALWRRTMPDLRCAVVAGHPVYWRSPAGLKVAIDASLTGLDHDTIDPMIYFDITSRLGSKPSNGIALLGWLRAIRGSLAGITVRGFALDDQAEGEAKRYFPDTPRQSPPPHDWVAERALFQNWMAET